MLEGREDRYLQVMKTALGKSIYTAVKGGEVFVFEGTVGILAEEMSEAARLAVYETLGVEPPLLRDPESEGGPQTLGDLASGSSEGDGPVTPGLIGRGPPTG